jgi:phage terminase Nu1 subunit (DNA packaging protein)
MPRKKHSTKKILRSSEILEVAAELDLNPETVRRFCREGAPHERKGKKYLLDVVEFQAWMKANGKTGEQGRPSHADSPDIEAARLRKENALAATYELRNSRERGELVPIDAVTVWMQKNFRPAQTRILGVAPKVVHLIQGRSESEQQVIIENALREALIETSESVESMADELATA